MYVPLEPGRPLDLDRLAAAFSARTRAIIVNTPSNPTGRVLTRAGARGHRASSAMRARRLAITDEIYEHIRFDGDHIPIATLPGMRERTVTISGASKTFSVTGWRVGWIIAPAGADRRHPQGARLPHGGRAGAAAGGRGGGARASWTRSSIDGLARDYRRSPRPASLGTRRSRASAAPRRRAPTTSWRTSPDWRELAAGGAASSTTPPSRSGSPVRSG